MRQVHFASAVAAALALLAATSSAAVISDNIGSVSLMIGSINAGDALNVAGNTVRIQTPRQINYDSQGNLYIAEFGSSRVLRVDATSLTSLTNVIGVLVDPNDDTKLYVSTWDTGSAATIQSFNVGAPTNRATLTSGHNRIHMVDYDVDSDVLYFPAHEDNAVLSVPKDGGSFTTVGSSTLPFSASVVQGAGHLFSVAKDDTVRQMSLDGSSNVVVAGAANIEGHDDGPGLTARFVDPLYSTLSRDKQYLFVTDPVEHRLRRMDATTYVVNSVFNPSRTSSTAEYPASFPDSLSARLQLPWCPTFNYAGDKLALAGDFAVMEIAYAPSTAPAPACDCDAEKLEAVYTSDAIPDATAEAISNISLDTNTWEVVFEVRNVKAIKNGHVIAAPVNTQETAANAFTPLVSAFDANDLWQPLECGLGGIDTPATSLKVRTEWDNAACRTKYEMRYSLISNVDRDDHYCDLTDDNAGNIKVNCSIVLSSTRAYSSTEAWAFVAQEAAFAAELNLGTYLNNEVTNLLHATMAKCSVKNGPLYVVDCRVPGVWNFDQGAFSVAQSPAGWINGASCASNVVGSDAATAATFIRCNIENDAPIANVERALANISATPTGNPSNALTFDVDFIVPRKVTTTASASLASFVQTIEMKDGRYFYGTADVATLEITVVDTARLSMTALELFNSATPTKQVYDIFPGTSDARFQTALNADATKFTIDFYPAAIREDSAFYRFGPHGINVSFTFSAARRAVGGGTGGQGNVLVEGLNVEGTEASAAQSQGSATSSSSGTALMVGVAVGAAVLVAGLVGAAAVAVKRRVFATEQKQQL